LIKFQKKELRTEMVIALNFEGIDKGVYPDGRLFESKDIVSPDVLKRLGLNIDLSGHLFVEEIVPDSVKAKLEENLEFVYYPDRFKIVLLEDDKTLFAADKERADVLKAIQKPIKRIFRKNSSTNQWSCLPSRKILFKPLSMMISPILLNRL